MKRCPACRRVENDDTLVFCRADGTALIGDSKSIDGDAGTVKIGSAPVASEVETSVLPQYATDAGVRRPTGPTTVLDQQKTISRTRELARPNRRRVWVLSVGAIVVIAVALSAYLYLSRGKNTTSKNSIAVLPLVNASNDPNTEYLSDGISEALINSLTELQQLRVIARSTAFRYKGRDVDPQTVGRELNVQTVLMGRVRQFGDTLNIQVDLVDASTGAQLWGAEYERKLSDVLSMKQTIAHEVMDKLRLKLSGEEQQRLTKRDTTNSEAYQFYLRGRFYWNKRTGEGLKKAVEQFQQAIEKDPSYALAYSGLADAYTTLPGYSATPASEVVQNARAAASRAIELDPNLAEAHASLARIKMAFESDSAGAEKEFQRAIQLNPNYPSAHHWYALLLAFQGRSDEAKKEILRAQQLDPLSLIINRTVGDVFFWAREYDQALEQYKKTIEIDANFPPAHEDLAMLYGIKGRYAEAIPEMNKAIALNGRLPNSVAVLGYIHAISGHKVEAQKMLDELTTRAKTEAVSPYAFALIYAGLGDKEKAFEWLDEATRKEAAGSNASLKVGPEWDGLRSDPRFAELLRRAGLPQ
jgi:TolB-like protein/tetratricopeptide (TPR) repeat protein